MGKLVVTLVIVLFFGCSPDTPDQTTDENSESTHNSPLDTVEKSRKKQEPTPR